MTKDEFFLGLRASPQYVANLEKANSIVMDYCGLKICPALEFSREDLAVMFYDETRRANAAEKALTAAVELQSRWGRSEGLWAGILRVFRRKLRRNVEG